MEPEQTGFRKTNSIIKISILAVLLIMINFAGLIFARYESFKSNVILENKSGSAPYIQYPEQFSSSLPEVKAASEELKQREEVLINILLLGNGGAGHPGGELTDTFQILSINPITNNALIISLPRDLYLKVEVIGAYNKLNEVYSQGEIAELGGGALAKAIASEILGLPIHYFLKIDFHGFCKLVDEIGGIEIYVDKYLYDSNFDMKLNLSPGLYHMDGDLALRYSRSRKTTSDFDRSARQQKVLMAIRQKIRDEGVINKPQKINSILKIIEQHFTTDIQIWEAIRIFDVVKDIPPENLTTKVIDNNPRDALLYSTASRGGAYILLPRNKNFDKIREFVQQNLP